jgi:hypothetical protein
LTLFCCFVVNYSSKQFGQSQEEQDEADEKQQTADDQAKDGEAIFLGETVDLDNKFTADRDTLKGVADLDVIETFFQPLTFRLLNPNLFSLQRGNNQTRKSFPSQAGEFQVSELLLG